MLDATTSRPPVLLTMASYCGTLAAVRSLGRAGVRVTVADPKRLAPACWSRFAVRALHCPSVDEEPARFLEWLVDFGAREPRHVLLPTSDDLAFLLASRRSVLAERFTLELPSLGSVYTLLNKRRLYHACQEVGIPVPETCVPEDEAALERVARHARFPLVIKPQTQVLLSPHLKGRVVHGREELRAQHAAFRATTRHAPLLLDHDRGASLPMVQSFADGAAAGIYGLSGYAGESGTGSVVVASRKLLQRPRSLGVGLCFEESAVEPGLAAKIAELCRRVGYTGVFEAEFVVVDGRHLLIDFNPRFYGQMAFEVDRGIDLPLLAYLSACGDTGGARAVLELAQERAREQSGRVFCNRVQTEFFLGMLRLAGRLRGAELRRWRGWIADHRERTTDAVFARDDWMPAVMDGLTIAGNHLFHGLRAFGVAREP